jgi:three-Cys-motif partner protein
MSEYEGREQSLVKHVILRKYLERFAHIIGSWKESITYVDCFSGPWNVRSANLDDSSFAIALAELRKARESSSKRNRDLRLRCFFIEKDQSAYQALKEFAGGANEAEIRTKNKTLEDAVPDILQFLDQDQESFPFILIDPTGWTGFELDVIAPLLKRKPGEVLVNFMTSFVRRFINSSDEATQRSFDRMYGPFKPSAAELREAAEEDLDDVLVTAYKRLLRKTGSYAHVCDAIVLHPEIDSAHFHLVYHTRHLKGVEVFKDAERKAMEMQEQSRAALRGKRMEKEHPSLFPASVMGRTRYSDDLRHRYLAKAKAEIRTLLLSKSHVAYDIAYAHALAYPIVQEQDLRAWIVGWQTEGLVTVVGLKPQPRVLQTEQGHSIERITLTKR